MINVKQLILPGLYRDHVRSWLKEVSRRQHELKPESFQIFGQDKLGDIAAYITHQVAVRCLPHAFTAVGDMEQGWEFGACGGCPGDGKLSEAVPGELGLKHIPLAYPVRWVCKPQRIAQHLGVAESLVYDAVETINRCGFVSWDDGGEMLVEADQLFLAPVTFLFDYGSDGNPEIHLPLLIERALDGVLRDEGVTFCKQLIGPHYEAFVRVGGEQH